MQSLYAQSVPTFQRAKNKSEAGILPRQEQNRAIYILILQQIEGNLIYPKVVGNSVGLPGIWVLVAVAIGGDLFGVIGMLLGVPTASVLYTLFKNNVYKKLREKNIK